MALPKELKFSATATTAPAPPMRSTLEGVEVQAVVAISAATRKVRRARIMVTPYFTANSITRHPFDNDSGVDIMGERLGPVSRCGCGACSGRSFSTPLTALSAADTDAES